MTCRECKNYKECNKQEKIKFELYDDGRLDEPYLCTYVESICQRFEKKRKCACCHSRKTNESLVFDYCDIHIEIPLCEECQKTATYNLGMQLKPLCTAISRAVTMSHIVGYDERKIREFQQKERESKGGVE